MFSEQITANPETAEGSTNLAEIRTSIMAEVEKGTVSKGDVEVFLQKLSEQLHGEETAPKALALDHELVVSTVKPGEVPVASVSGGGRIDT